MQPDFLTSSAQTTTHRYEEGEGSNRWNVRKNKNAPQNLNIIVVESRQSSPMQSPHNFNSDIVVDDLTQPNQNPVVKKYENDDKQDTTCMGSLKLVAFNEFLRHVTDIPKHVRDAIEIAPSLDVKLEILQNYRTSHQDYVDVSFREKLSAGYSAVCLYDKVKKALGEHTFVMTHDEKKDILRACKAIKAKWWLNPGESTGELLPSSAAQLDQIGKKANRNTSAVMKANKVNLIFFSEIGRKLTVGRWTSASKMERLNPLDVQALCSEPERVYRLSYQQLSAIPEKSIQGTEATNLINFCKQIKDPSREEEPDVPAISIHSKWMQTKIKKK